MLLKFYKFTQSTTVI